MTDYSHAMEAPPVITPLPENIKRPLFSVMIPAHNRLSMLQDTLRSVMEQDMGAGAMQIEVVDDASTEDIKGLVDSIGGGRIAYFRHENNVGSLKNFETCLNRSRGHLVHLLHSDDLIKPGYYRKMQALFEKFPEAGAAFCRFEYIDTAGRFLFNHDREMEQDGLLGNWLERLAEKQRIQYCAITVKREVYEKLGGFYGITYGEDWEMWLRIARHFPVAYSPDILAVYRMHDDSISGASYLAAKNLQDMQWVIRTAASYLPENKKERLAAKAMKFYAHYGLRVANHIWHSTRNKHAVKRQVKEALKMHRDLAMYYKISRLYTKMLFNIP